MASRIEKVVIKDREKEIKANRMRACAWDKQCERYRNERERECERAEEMERCKGLLRSLHQNEDKN